MKNIFSFAILLLSFSFTHSQSITGNWEGSLSIQGASLPIIFHIKDTLGKYSATFDSPRQMAYGLPCSNVKINADSVVLEMKNIGGKYEGIANAGKTSITGSWSQGGMSLPLDMKKTGSIATAGFKRPQTPRPPFEYVSEEVSYFNKDKSIQFGGTFTYPKTAGTKFPCVLLITGSGQQDRDETLFEHKPFAVIADYLTRNGIAVLRVDDRGKGKTTGNFSQSTTADFANDAEAGIDYLETKANIDIANIGLLGHSEGGMIAPMVASGRKDVKFIVLLAGPGIPVVDLMQRQNVDMLVSSGISPSDAAQYGVLYKNLLTSTLGAKDTVSAAENATTVFNYWQTTVSPATVGKTTGVTDEKSKTIFIHDFIRPQQAPWMNYFLKFNPADYLGKLKCAVLALNGEKDIQVAAAPNLEAIRKIMVENTVKTFKVQQLPGLNHLFQHCKTCTVQEYAELEETFAPEALQIIGDWIKEVVSK